MSLAKLTELKTAPHSVAILSATGSSAGVEPTRWGRNQKMADSTPSSGAYKSGNGGAQRAGREQVAPTTAKTPDRNQKSGIGGCLVGALVIGGLLWFGVKACAPDGDSETSLQIQAEDTCKDWVKDKLKAPSTAGFSGEKISGSGGNYKLYGNVDSENSFGAKIRSTWACTIKQADGAWEGSVDVIE